MGDISCRVDRIDDLVDNAHVGVCVVESDAGGDEMALDFEFLFGVGVRGGMQAIGVLIPLIRLPVDIGLVVVEEEVGVGLGWSECFHGWGMGESRGAAVVPPG